MKLLLTLTTHLRKRKAEKVLLRKNKKSSFYLFELMSVMWVQIIVIVVELNVVWCGVVHSTIN